MSCKSCWKRSTQDTFTCTKGSTKSLTLFVQFTNINGIDRPDASSNRFSHTRQYFERCIATSIFHVTQTYKVFFIFAIRINVTKFCLKFHMNPIFKGFGFCWRTLSFHIMMTSFAIQMKDEYHGKGFAQLEHPRPLIVVLHPHHGLTGQITNRVVNVPPKDATFFVTTIGSIETESCQETNGSRCPSKASTRHAHHTFLVYNQFIPNG
mmetsp:Transcript_3356/g.4584  ORF Transcript_3356/g.4584 Transcript_3356/m.4584 type:complete len:208 (-) Transcript_3356:740-1363(-)